jgi:hypothetical protein
MTYKTIERMESLLTDAVLGHNWNGLSYWKVGLPDFIIRIMSTFFEAVEGEVKTDFLFHRVIVSYLTGCLSSLGLYDLLFKIIKGFPTPRAHENWNRIWKLLHRKYPWCVLFQPVVTSVGPFQPEFLTANGKVIYRDDGSNEGDGTVSIRFQKTSKIV